MRKRIPNRKARLATCLGFLLAVLACARKPAPVYQLPAGVSWSSVLREQTLASLAEPVPAWARSRQFSSASVPGRAMLANLAPQIFGDMDHGFFQRVEEHDGFVDATLAEMRGPGMLTWMWSANPVGSIRLFIDRNDAPVLEMPFTDFLLGGFLPKQGPFAGLTANGYNLHFPIVHTNFCRVVVRVPHKKDLAELYYQIAWNTLPPGGILNAFTLDDVQRGGAVLEALGRTWLETSEGSTRAPTQVVEIAAGAETELFTSENPGTISRIVLEAGGKAELAGLHVVALWDGAATPALDAPLHLLAGVSRVMENVRSLPATVHDARVELRWPMPFGKARIMIRNSADWGVRIRHAMEVDRTPIGTDMRFGAQASVHAHLQTDGANQLVLATLMGAGHIVGCVIQVDSRTPEWWGEGDQRIYLDSVLGPAWQGTGTEDYFGLAWCSRSVFEHPLRGQSIVDDQRTGRLTAMHRYHVLDRLPFHQHARFETEAWGVAPGTMDYEALVLYYRDSRGTRDTTTGTGGAY